MGAAAPLDLTTPAGDLLVHPRPPPAAHFLAGGSPEDYFRWVLGDRERRPPALLGPAAPLRSLVEVAAGAALAFRMRDEARVAMVFSPPGTHASGAWHEGFNFAAVRRCPLVVVTAAPDPEAKRAAPRRGTRLKTLRDVCTAYGVAGRGADAADVTEIHRVASEAVGAARRGAGVQLLELRGRPPADGGIRALERRLSESEEGALGEEEGERVAAEVVREVEEAWERAVSDGGPMRPDAAWAGRDDVRSMEPWRPGAEGGPRSLDRLSGAGKGRG